MRALTPMSTTAFSTGERVGVFTARRVRALSGATQLRLLATALGAFLLIDYLRLTVVSPLTFADTPLVVVMDLVSYAALLTLLWRPRLGMVLAAIPLTAAIFWTPTGLESVLLLLVPAIGLAQVGRRTAVAVAVLLVAFVVARAALAGPFATPVAVTLGLNLAVGLLCGAAMRYMAARRERRELSEGHAAAESARIRADERRTLSRELHDVVSHHLSTASLQLMGVDGNEDEAALRRVLTTVGRETGAALTELRLLVDVLRDDPSTAASGTEIRELAEHLTPTQAAAAAQQALVAAGFDPSIEVPARADQLEMTVQRTLSRTLREAVANVVAYAAPRTRCAVRITVDAQLVTLQVSSALPAGFAGARLGWGLRGLRERARLTGGSFAAGPQDGAWVVALTLPHEA